MTRCSILEEAPILPSVPLRGGHLAACRFGIGRILAARPWENAIQPWRKLSQTSSLALSCLVVGVSELVVVEGCCYPTAESWGPLPQASAYQ